MINILGELVLPAEIVKKRSGIYGFADEYFSENIHLRKNFSRIEINFDKWFCRFPYKYVLDS